MVTRRPAFLTIVASLALGLVLFGCEKKETESRTEVKDKLLGGTEVKRTEVTRQGDKIQVRKEKTELGANGDKKKVEVKVQGDKLD